MSEKYKKLYEAQKAEHEKTWERMRKAELMVKTLRSELVSEQNKYKNLSDFIRASVKNTLEHL